jgi:hypothetical protein
MGSPSEVGRVVRLEDVHVTLAQLPERFDHVSGRLSEVAGDLTGDGHLGRFGCDLQYEQSNLVHKTLVDHHATQGYWPYGQSLASPP